MVSSAHDDVRRLLKEFGVSADETVMAYINARAVLAARSPARFGFLQSHRASWLPFLRSRPPVGDFPVPTGAGRLA